MKKKKKKVHKDRLCIPPDEDDARNLITFLGRSMQGYLEKGIQTPMAKGRSTKIISMIKWIRTSRL